MRFPKNFFKPFLSIFAFVATARLHALFNAKSSFDGFGVDPFQSRQNTFIVSVAKDG
jgi:hypothetical protein